MKNFKAYQPNSNDYELVQFWPSADINISFPLSLHHDFICGRLNRTNSAILLYFNFQQCRYEIFTPDQDILEQYFARAYQQWSINIHRTHCINLSNINLAKIIGAEYAPIYIKPKEKVH